MSTEQLREEFEVWYTEEYTSYIPRSGNGYSNLDTELAWQAYQAGRAALQSQPSHAGWKEAAIAWEVCASLHREYCKGKDPFFKTRQADFVRHVDDARKQFSEQDTPKTQPQAEPSEWLKQHEALMHRVSKAAIVVGYGGTINGVTAEQALENAEIALLDHARALQSQDREDAERLDFLDAKNMPYKMGWNVGIAPAGNVSISSVIQLGGAVTTIREAIDHARRRIEGEGK